MTKSRSILGRTEVSWSHSSSLLVETRGRKRTANSLPENISRCWNGIIILALLRKRLTDGRVKCGDVVVEGVEVEGWEKESARVNEKKSFESWKAVDSVQPSIVDVVGCATGQ